jgi:phosphatidate cytidylyltransferase
VNNFTLRTITGAVFVIVIIGSVLVGHYIFAGLFLIISLAGFYEFTVMCKLLNAYPSKISGTLVAAITYGLIVALNFKLVPVETAYLLVLVPVILLITEMFS